MVELKKLKVGKFYKVPTPIDMKDWTLRRDGDLLGYPRMGNPPTEEERLAKLARKYRVDPSVPIKVITAAPQNGPPIVKVQYIDEDTIRELTAGMFNYYPRNQFTELTDSQVQKIKNFLSIRSLKQTSKQQLEDKLPKELVSGIGSFLTGKKGDLDQQLSALKSDIDCTEEGADEFCEHELPKKKAPKVPSSFEAWTPSGTSILAEIVAILQKGAKPNQKDANGKTVLMKLIEYPQFTQLEYKQIVEALVNGGLSLSVQDYDGATALHYAVKEFVRKYDPENDRQHNLSGYQNEIGLIKLLIEMGSPYRKDSHGKLPIDYLTDTVWFNPVRDLFNRQRTAPAGSAGAGSGATSGGRKTKKTTRKLRKTRRR